jgi:hypothetical protein
MDMNRMGNTGREMLESGAWMKVAAKHYLHVSGAEIIYDWNRWVWQIVGGDAYEALWVARYNVERKAA